MISMKAALLFAVFAVGSSSPHHYDRKTQLADHKRLVNLLTVSMNRECKSANVGDDTMKIVREVLEAKYKDKEPPCLANKTHEEIKKLFEDKKTTDAKEWEEAKKAVFEKITGEDEKAKVQACFSGHEKHAEAFMARGYAWGLYTMLHQMAEEMGIDDITVEDIHRIMDSKKMGRLSINKHPCQFTPEEQKSGNSEITQQWEEVKKDVLVKHNTDKVKELCTKYEAKLKVTFETWPHDCKHFKGTA